MSSVDGATRLAPLRWRPPEPEPERRRRQRPRRAQTAVVLAVVSLAAVLVLPLVALGTAGADPSAKDWQTLRTCESGGRYGIVATNGHYGAYQFDLATWRSVGGTGSPSDASPAEQDYRALYLYRMRGWQPWECAGLRSLRPDSDAKSRQVPTRSDSRYMAPGGSGKASGTSAWPGRVFAPGDCADELKTWQLRMNAYGYGFTGTGCYGDKTNRAVLDLQTANGIRASGLLGPKTWQAAWTGTPPARR